MLGAMQNMSEINGTKISDLWDIKSSDRLGVEQSIQMSVLPTSSSSSSSYGKGQFSFYSYS
jgi:hypothetical protein